LIEVKKLKDEIRYECINLVQERYL